MTDRELKLHLERTLTLDAAADEKKERLKQVVLISARCKARREWTPAPCILPLVRFIAPRILLAQGGTLLLSTGLLYALAPLTELQSPRAYAMLLCALSFFACLTALPALLKSHRYGMHTVEAATPFSTARLFLLRVLLTFLGDGVLFVLLSVLATRELLPFGATSLYLLVPFMLSGTALTLLPRLVRTERLASAMTATLLGLATVTCTLLELFPQLLTARYLPVWAGTGAALLGIMLTVLWKTLEELQLIPALGRNA